MNIYNRKQFLTRTVLGSAGLFFFSPTIAQQPVQEKGPPLNNLEVKEFVGAAHKDYSKVKTMLEGNGDLLNSVNNLGGWDWEDAVSAAGHVGNHEIANYLLQKGARMTICVAAMLGKLNVVVEMIESFPYMKNAVGPHKISLMRHAKAGESAEVIEYLKTLGLKD